MVAMKAFKSSGIDDVGARALTIAKTQIAAQGQVLIDDLRQAEYRAALTRQAADLGPALALAQGKIDGSAQGMRILRRTQEAVPIVAHDLSRNADGGRHYGKSAGQRLDDRQTKSLIVARRHVQIGALQILVHALAVTGKRNVGIQMLGSKIGGQFLLTTVPGLAATAN